MQNHRKNIGIRSKMTGKSTGIRSKITAKHRTKMLNDWKNTGIRSEIT